MEDSLTSAYKPDFATLKRMFTESRDLTADARKEAQIDDDYFHGYQLTAEERRVLQQRKQPDTVFNRVRPAVLGTLGVLKQGKTDPRAYPRNPDDEDSAEVVSKTLRFIADTNDFDGERVECAQDYLTRGTTAIVVEVDQDRKVIARKIAWEEYFYDPRSRKADLTDARYHGIAKWMYADDVAALYPDKKGDILLTVDGGNGAADETFADRPRDSMSNWIDARKRRVMLVEIYHREGQDWYRCVFYGGGLLEAAESPYTDAKGRPDCAIIGQSCFIDRENNRYGIVRDMRGPQDEINKRRQKLLHMLNNRQVQATGANAELALATDADTVRAEASRPDGVLPMGWAPVTLTDLTAGQFNLLGEAKSEIERMGPNPAVLGRQGEGSSGRAQLVRQQAGFTELAVIFGGIEAWELRVYRAMWSRAKQFWTAPDYVRVTDDEGAPQFIGINQPQHGEAQIGMDPQTGMAMIYRPVLGYENQLAEMDVDITLDTVPDTANIAQEQFLALVDLAKAGVAIPPQVLIDASSLPKKREIIEKMQQLSQQPDPAREGQDAKLKADINKTESETFKNVVTANVAAAGAHLNALQTGMQAGQGMETAAG